MDTARKYTLTATHPSGPKYRYEVEYINGYQPSPAARAKNAEIAMENFGLWAAKAHPELALSEFVVEAFSEQ